MQKKVGPFFYKIGPPFFNQCILGLNLCTQDKESHSRFSTVQKELEELNLLSQEIFSAVQNSIFFVSPTPFCGLVAYSVLEVSTIDLLLVLSNLRHIFSISSIYSLEIFGNTGAICESFGSISIFITQIFPNIVKYWNCLFLATFCIFAKAFKKLLSISSRLWSKSIPTKVNFMQHLWPKDPAISDLSRPFPKIYSIVLDLFIPNPDRT